jgi:GAF domain-containing protein
MDSNEPVRSGIDALAQFLVGDTSMADTLQRIIDLTAETVPTAKYTGLTMLVDDKVTTSVFSDPDVPEIDQAQYEANDGPCLDAFRDGEVNEIPSTERDDRWPEFSRAALDYGIRSTLSLPLVAGGNSLGALNLYSDHENGFADGDHRRAAQAMAVQAAVVLANAQAYWDARSLAEHLEEAMKSRATIEQAKGIVIGQSNVDPDTAFEMLRSASQRENRKLRDVAQGLVERHSGGTTPP